MGDGEFADKIRARGRRCMAWAIAALEIWIALLVLLLFSDWVLFEVAVAEDGESGAPFPLVEKLVPSGQETYYLKEDRHLHWVRTSYEATNTFGGRVLRFSGHWFSPRRKTTAWTYGHSGKSEPTDALFTVRHAGVASLSYTYRVYDVDGRLRYSIRKSFWGGRCRFFFFRCKPEWFIYRGWVGGEVAYYGIGEDEHEAESPQFFFYPSKEESFDEWSAFLDHRRRTQDDEDIYEVTVRSGEDAALLLTAATIIDRWADATRRHPPPPLLGDTPEAAFLY